MTRWERCKAIFNPVFWRTVPKAILWVSIASVVALFVKAIVLDQIPAPFQWMNSVGDAVSGLLNSVVASAIFYLVANHYDEVRRQKIYGPQIAGHVQTVWTALGTMLSNLGMKTAMAREIQPDLSGQYFFDLSADLSRADFVKLLADGLKTEFSPISSIKCLGRLQEQMNIYFARYDAMQAIIGSADVLNHYLDEELRERLAACQQIRGLLWALVSGNHQGGTSETLASYMNHYYQACLRLRGYIKSHPFYGA